MHFEEALLGNTLLSRESMERERYIATNRFKVRKNAGAKFEKRWADRKSRLAELAGFRFFTLLKRVDAFDSDYSTEGDSGNYISFTIWENKDNFDAWRTGDAFKEAHGGGSIFGFIELISTALFIIEGSPKPAFYDALLPTAGQTIEVEKHGGWRKVEADGVTELTPEVFVAQSRFEVPNDSTVLFEQTCRNSLSTDGQLNAAHGFVGFFVQRRDATKADDGFNYVVSTMWTDRRAYSSWLASSQLSTALHNALSMRPKQAYFEGKLVLSSSQGI